MATNCGQVGPCKIIVGHKYWGRGGAEVAAMWVLEAIRGFHSVHLITRGGFDIPELNRLSGTSISKDDLRILRPPLVSGFRRFGVLWAGLYERAVRKIAQPYDLCITLSGVEDWGRPAVHFLSDVVWNEALTKTFGGSSYRYAGSGAGLWKRAYVLMGRIAAGRSGRDPTQHDSFVANSNWTAIMSRRYCRREPVVVYPAVAGLACPRAWQDRDDRIVILGRLSREKRIEDAVSIAGGLRGLGHSIQLHVVGEPDDPVYAREVNCLLQASAGFVVRHGVLRGARKYEMLSGCRYGLSTCRREAFGIATVEMMKAGLVPFVPEEGAQAEVVTEPNLIFNGVPDAVQKIHAVLRDPVMQSHLHSKVQARASAFSPERFQSEVRSVIDEALWDCAARAR